jgi:hypothetical protein
LDIAPRNQLIFRFCESFHPPFAQKALKGDVHVHQDHPALGEQQVNVVDHLGAAAVRIQNRLPHEVFVEQNPAFLVVEGRIRVAGLGGRDEDGLVLNPCHLPPWNKFAGTALAVFDVDSNGLRVRFGKPKNQVRQPAILAVGLVTANPAMEELGKIEQLKRFKSGRLVGGIGGGIIHGRIS